MKLNMIEALLESHAELLAMAKLQIKQNPKNTIAGLEKAVENDPEVELSEISEALASADEWELAAQLLAKAIQNPSDTETAWRSVIAFFKINGSTTPRL